MPTYSLCRSPEVPHLPRLSHITPALYTSITSPSGLFFAAFIITWHDPVPLFAWLQSLPLPECKKYLEIVPDAKKVFINLWMSVLKKWLIDFLINQSPNGFFNINWALRNWSFGIDFDSIKTMNMQSQGDLGTTWYLVEEAMSLPLSLSPRPVAWCKPRSMPVSAATVVLRSFLHWQSLFWVKEPLILGGNIFLKLFLKYECVPILGGTAPPKDVHSLTPRM